MQINLCVDVGGVQADMAKLDAHRVVDAVANKTQVWCSTSGVTVSPVSEGAQAAQSLTT